MTSGFTPPPYPYDRLGEIIALADQHDGGRIDMSIGTPTDPPPKAVVDALADDVAARGYPASVGYPEYRDAAAAWVDRRFGVSIPATQVAACVGTKEFVAGLPAWLRLRTPDRDSVLYPAVSYPSYAMGATLAGCRAVPVPVRDDFTIDVTAISDDDAARALCLWVNTPGNPAGGLDDLAEAARWGRDVGVPVFSDECYAEFTWEGPPRTILSHGADNVVAVHSLSKRSNLAGARIGFYAGDGDLVSYLGEVRKHAGFMPSGPSQRAGALAWNDDAHVARQRDLYRQRLGRMIEVLEAMGVPAGMPAGAFYLFPEVGDAWEFATRLAREIGVVASPGDFYGDQAAARVRLAMVQPLERIDEAARRLGLA